MKNLTNNAIAILFVSLIIYLNSCVDTAPPDGNDADFTHFEFVYMLDSAKIDRDKKTIYANIDLIADLSNLIPTFVLTQGATAYIKNVVQQSGVSASNFSKVVEYEIVSENKQTKNIWTVFITQKYIKHDDGDNPTFNSNATIPAGTYTMNGTITIGDSIYFEIQPDVKLILGANAKFIIGKGARFIARGTDNKPITFTTETENWDGFVFNSVEEAEFNFCKIENAGQPNSQLMQINNSNIGIINSEFTNINCTGFLFDNSSTFRAFDKNTLTNVAKDNGYPIIFNSINSCNNLGENNYINSTKGILVKDGTIKSSITLVAQTCPYIVENDITCNVSDITFFIRNGVNIKINNGKGISVGNTKMVFKAEGTKDKPIIFDCNCEDNAGWNGISISGNILTTSNLTYCNIYYAGNSNNLGAIKCNNTDTTKLTIQNCLIKDPGAHGIYFTKSSNAKMPPDNQNTFSGITADYKDIYREGEE